MIRKSILTAIFFSLIYCKPVNKNNLHQQQLNLRCKLIEEKFENSSMKIFLQNTKNDRQIINAFLSDSSALAYLSIIEGKSVFAKSKNKNNWECYQNDTYFDIENDKLFDKINEYANLNIVFKLNCPKDFGILDGNNGFQAIWIKRKGTIKFLYYSTIFNINTLNEKDKSRVVSLIDLDDLFEKK